MGDKEKSATSFGSMAGTYDRVRPGPAPAAVDWLVPPGCAVVVDLAAGTGLFTRALEGRAEQVVAVEPDERMRRVLAAQSPGVRVLNGRAEDIPLPDGCADAVFVSHAWHWFDPMRTVPEIAPVLADGGCLGVLWTSRDRGEGWVAGLDVIGSPDHPRTPDEAMERQSRQHKVSMPEGAPFSAAETASFGFDRIISVDDTLDWLATASQVITADPPDRAAGLARARAALRARSFLAGGTELVSMPMRSWCWRARRLPRLRLSGKDHTTGRKRRSYRGQRAADHGERRSRARRCRRLVPVGPLGLMLASWCAGHRRSLPPR
jgi:SAM-dependent methyltransferase